MMHSLEEGFSIVMYSCTHTAPPTPHALHCAQGLRIILPKDCVILWHQGCLHSGAKSRLNKFGTNKPDMRLFSYIWTDGSLRVSSKTLSRSMRQDGTQVHRNQNLLCKQFYEIDHNCSKCSESLKIFDLTNFPSTSYSPGQRMFGDLECLGWVICRGMRVTPKQHYKINAISDLGAWHPIKKNKMRNMKYKLGSPIHHDWTVDEDLIQLFKDIKLLLLDTRLPTTKYQIGKFNLLKNVGIMEDDQLPHYDYPNQFDGLS